MQLRDYQRDVVDRALQVMRTRNIVYLAAEVRTGKNIMSITIAKELGWRKVCFITKLNAIPDVEREYANLGQPFSVFVVKNFEQAEKLTNIFDGFIIDESHSCGAYAKPSKRTKVLRDLIGYSPVILMSGTPSPESLSQLYHQFWITQYGPWQEYANFYKWAKKYVDVRKRFINGYEINDYSRAYSDKVNADVEPFMVRVSQVEAGFTSFVEDVIHYVQIDQRMYKLMEHLRKYKVYRLKDGSTIVCDSPVKLQSAFHQLSSGTLKVGEKRYTFDESKAWYIKTKFAGQKIGIFYKFIQEGEVLKKVFPNWTDDHQVFNSHNNLVYIKQCVSGREGSNLSTADALVAYNIDFSATTYWQLRARMQTRDRTKESKLHFIFSQEGIERYVYNVVTKKKNFTRQYFDKMLKTWNPGSRPELFATSKNAATSPSRSSAATSTGSRISSR